MSSIIIDKLKQIEKASRDENQNKSGTASSSADSVSSRKKGRSGDHESIDQLSSDHISSGLRSEDSEYYEAYHMAKVWTGKLRKLSHCQKLFAEKAIHDILFEAQLGNLHKSSVKINGKPSRNHASSVTSHSPSSYTSKSTNSSPLSSSLLESNHSDHVGGASSEVLIRASYPNDNALLSTEDVTAKANLTNVNATRESTRNQTFIVAASPNTLRKVPSNTSSCQNTTVEVDNGKYTENITTIANAATNTPDCILRQLSRYIRDCYDNCKTYLPPAQQFQNN